MIWIIVYMQLSIISSMIVSCVVVSGLQLVVSRASSTVLQQNFKAKHDSYVLTVYSWYTIESIPDWSASFIKETNSGSHNTDCILVIGELLFFFRYYNLAVLTTEYYTLKCQNLTRSHCHFAGFVKTAVCDFVMQVFISPSIQVRMRSSHSACFDRYGRALRVLHTAPTMRMACMLPAHPEFRTPSCV